MLGATAQPPPQHDPGLVGRTREIPLIAALLDNVDRLPAVLRLVGEAGIGKSTLWDHALSEARKRHYICLSARPEQSESRLAFAAFGDLLSDAYPLVAAELPEPRRSALAAALLLEDAPAAPEQRTLGVATLSVFQILARRGPVVIAIDDEQWIDHASLAVLSFALRRLTGEPVAVLLASRPAATGKAKVSLETRLPTEEVVLGGLSIGALHAIVVERFGTVLARPKLRRLHELSRGNPFLALELVRAANSGQFRLDPAEKGSADLDRLVGARLDDLPEATRLCLFAAAAAARPTIGLLNQAVEADALTMLVPAIDVGIVETTATDVQFSHPILASAAYGAVSGESAREIHARLARLTDDHVERARHLALAATEPDEKVAAEAERAAQQVFRRGAPAAAAELAALAVRMTPADSLSERSRRTAMQSEYLFESGDTASASALLEPLIAIVPAGIERATLLAQLARIKHFGDDIESGLALSLEALQDAAGSDRLVASLHEGIAWALFLIREDLAGAAQHAKDAVGAARRAGDDVALAEAYAVEAVTTMAIGSPSRDAINRAVALEPAMSELRVLRHPSYAKAYVMLCTDRLDEARALLEDLLARAEEHGDESAVPPILVQLSMTEILAGKWDVAEDHSRLGYALAEQGGQAPARAALRSRQALLAVMRGQLTEGEDLARESLSLAGANDDDAGSVRRAISRGGEIGAWALGAAALGAGRFDEAATHLMLLADTLLDAGMREPGELRFLPDAVEALLGQGRLEDAERLVVRLESMAEHAQRTTSIGVAARCRALLLAQSNDLIGAKAAADRAVKALEAGTLPFDLARAQLSLGDVQRRMRQKRTARATLEASLGAFESLGADGYRDRALEEIGRIGGRGQSDGGLTPTESRVAQLVATGMSNKEVATALTISSKTVELHLSHVYAKLEVGSRTELVRMMAHKN